MPLLHFQTSHWIGVVVLFPSMLLMLVLMLWRELVHTATSLYN